MPLSKETMAENEDRFRSFLCSTSTMPLSTASVSHSYLLQYAASLTAENARDKDQRMLTREKLGSWIFEARG